MRTKITKAAVDALKPGSGEAFLWETETTGFGCKISAIAGLCIGQRGVVRERLPATD